MAICLPRGDNPRLTGEYEPRVLEESDTEHWTREVSFLGGYYAALCGHNGRAAQGNGKAHKACATCASAAKKRAGRKRFPK